MNESRRDFLKNAILLSGSAGFSSLFPGSVKKAFLINPEQGSSYLDAEHIVILMQENRSFDHTFGTLRGVRGFGDPAAISLPNGNSVFLQSDENGKTFLPFHFDIKNTKATWMGSTPHSRSSQVDAWNNGLYDNWIPSKRVSNEKYKDIPLTMGYYTRKDIPFYYALADAFTVCDQNFSSAMTSTNPNRLFFWTGTVRENSGAGSKAIMRNLSSDRWGVLKFKTFPERLEEAGITWKFYQNDIDCGGGFSGEERAWLANFGCNPLEWFANYNVKFSERYQNGLKKQIEELPAEIEGLKKKLSGISDVNNPDQRRLKASIDKKIEVLANAKSELREYSIENLNRLPKEKRNLFDRAFSTNSEDRFYHDLTQLSYEDQGVKRDLNIPKGDVLYQFRKDVEEDNLPFVSWLSGAQFLSDHPSAPWYGSLYASEILNILTNKPEVWKKTIFIVTFDENDGYFDHVLPFVASDPRNPNSGKSSDGIDTESEFIYMGDELTQGLSRKIARSGPVGLGFRVPMIIASPWSRGGKVCSQVFDHTSTLQFLETFFYKKLGKRIFESNISPWRRAICGDLTAAFKDYQPHEVDKELPFLNKKAFIEDIYNAKFGPIPNDFEELTDKEIGTVNKKPLSFSRFPRQEKGSRISCAIPYELYVGGTVSAEGDGFEVSFSAQKNVFGDQSMGSAFNVRFPNRYVQSRAYTVKAGDTVRDFFPTDFFESETYHICAYGPNGFLREFKGLFSSRELDVKITYEKGVKKGLTGNVILNCLNLSNKADVTFLVEDNYQGIPSIKRTLKPLEKVDIPLNLKEKFNWYDFTVRKEGSDSFRRRFSGHVETGEDSYSDPRIGS